MNIGISVFTAPNTSIWSSGINQNLAFLVLLLRQSREVQGIYLIDGGLAGSLPSGMEDVLPQVPLVRPEAVTHRVDVVIEMGAQLPLEWMHRVRALGTRLVLFVPGHTFANVAENPIFGRDGGLTFTGCPWDEVWSLPQHMHSCAPLLRTLARVPVHEVPHLWSPAYLQRNIDASASDAPFGFTAERRERRAGWRVGIFEPNISVVKSGMIPMLACEQAYRQDRSAIESMMALNTLHLKEHPSFHSVAAGLDLTRDGRASFEPRVAFAECMIRHQLDMVVSHHWECGLNYLYYDALHGGYPLVHNSDFLQRAGVGLHYPGFEAATAARVLLQAREHGPAFWADYRRRARAFLQTLAPEHPANVEAFVGRLRAGSGRPLAGVRP